MTLRNAGQKRDQAGRRRAVVVVVDGWGAGFAGPYGNTWLETPVCNELAARGWLWDQAHVASRDPQLFASAVWQGLPPGTSHPLPYGSSIMRELAETARRTRLVTDDPALVHAPLTQSFHEAQLVSGPIAEDLAVELEETALARFFAAAVEAYDESDWDLLWLQTQGMAHPWDAPLEYRRQFMDEDDPEPPCELHPPRGRVPPDVDPDWLQGWTWAYAAQVSVLDGCLQPFLERWCGVTDERPTLWVVMGQRGFSLGEHGYVGECDEELHTPSLHIPWMMGTNGFREAPFRFRTLVQPDQLFATLCEWFQLPKPAHAEGVALWLPSPAPAAEGAPRPPSQDRAVAVSREGAAWAWRTPQWFATYRSSTLASEERDAQRSHELACRLYLKPDDRWDANDVATRCEKVVGAFDHALERWREWAAAEPTSTVPDMTAWLAWYRKQPSIDALSDL